jgi:intracellular sulfur oxidation DsrE/DsrF family protein
MIYEQSEDVAHAELEVVMALHGSDIPFFATNETGKYDDIVDLAAKLDAFGVFDFKLCAATASRLEVAESEVPAFIEFVPYGPQEIDRLKEAGFINL